MRLDRRAGTARHRRAATSLPAIGVPGNRRRAVPALRRCFKLLQRLVTDEPAHPV